MKELIQGVKGTRDFYPEDMAFRTWLYRKLGEVSRRFGYQEYDGPFLEKIDLYAAKSGEELVKEQSFVFPDRGGDLITLRPELTPSLARMVAARQNELVFPLRWWSFGPFWRYERPQKGRTREFFQWNIDLMGVNSREADAEMLAVGCAFFKQVGLTPAEVMIAFNDRQLMEAEITALGVPAGVLKDVYRFIDRRDKLAGNAWLAYGVELGLSEGQLAAIQQLLGNKELWKKSPALASIAQKLAAWGWDAYIQYDPGIIRGLDYYTGIVFEARDRSGGRAIFGGGRYDNLVGDVGGQPTGGLGFAMGDVVIRLVLDAYGRMPALQASPAEILVTLFDADGMVAAAEVANLLREEGFNTELYPELTKLPRQFKYADRKGLRYIIVLGPEEREKGAASVKDLRTGLQQIVPLQGLPEFLRGKG